VDHPLKQFAPAMLTQKETGISCDGNGRETVRCDEKIDFFIIIRMIYFLHMWYIEKPQVI
jgi:hypothetical protein